MFKFSTIASSEFVTQTDYGSTDLVAHTWISFNSRSSVYDSCNQIHFKLEMSCIYNGFKCSSKKEIHAA